MGKDFNFGSPFATAPSDPVSGVALLGQVRPVLRKDILDQEVKAAQGGFARFRLR